MKEKLANAPATLPSTLPQATAGHGLDAAHLYTYDTFHRLPLRIFAHAEPYTVLAGYYGYGNGVSQLVLLNLSPKRNAIVITAQVGDVLAFVLLRLVGEAVRLHDLKQKPVLSFSF